MSKTAVIFAGTTEGRQIAEQLARAGVQTEVCVATEYGAGLLEALPTLHVQARRMKTEEMAEFFREKKPELVIDATHPYASLVTENIKEACNVSGYPYLRMQRASSQNAGASLKERNVIYVQSVKEAVEYLENTRGNVLLTTGSKELAGFTALTDYEERLYARVLSLPKVVADCDALGFRGKHLICMQGPFSLEMNLAMMQQIHAEYMVTKESGHAGGFEEKYEAAMALDKTLIIIGRPAQCEGMTYEECMHKLEEVFTLQVRPEISLVGIGMGNSMSRTGEANLAFAKAQLIIGARRMVDSIIQSGQDAYHAYDAKEIAAYIKEHPQYTRIAIALSGDVGFYSGAKKLLKELDGEVTVIPGISSLPYFCAKLKTSWDDVKVASIHGKQDQVIGMIQKYEKVFVLAGTKDGAGNICSKLVSYGLGHVQVAIGEQLSYKGEKISKGTAKEFQGIETDALSVLLFENPMAKNAVVTHGIPDEAFLRDKVPMTKEEIRSISLSKLHLTKDAVVYDVGAGTGSVSIEMAACLENGMVYAIEKNPTAVGLLEQNKRKFAADNLVLIEGLAPEGLVDLPAPTHAFIGGSSGNLKEILSVLFEKNPKVRVVLNAITLETIQEAMECLKIFDVEDVDIAAVSVAKSKTLGRYHMMMGQNPVYVISFTGQSM
jgi:precorrin-6Y C5,15-methyltransferase (decarboxylating)